MGQTASWIIANRLEWAAEGYTRKLDAWRDAVGPENRARAIVEMKKARANMLRVARLYASARVRETTDA
jgi:hypothetical protein